MEEREGSYLRTEGACCLSDVSVHWAVVLATRAPRWLNFSRAKSSSHNRSSVVGQTHLTPPMKRDITRYLQERQKVSCGPGSFLTATISPFFNCASPLDSVHLLFRSLQNGRKEQPGSPGNDAIYPSRRDRSFAEMAPAFTTRGYDTCFVFIMR